MKKKFINSTPDAGIPATNVSIRYKVSMKVKEQSFVDLYDLPNLDDAIKASLSVYANIPTTLQVVLTDSSGITHLILNRYA